MTLPQETELILRLFQIQLNFAIGVEKSGRKSDADPSTEISVYVLGLKIVL